MKSPLLMSNEEIEMKAMKAILLFQDGWSMNMSMAKAGFATDWRRREQINSHPLVNKLRDMYHEKLKRKNPLHHRLSFT